MKNALITGSSRGLGLALARQLAQKDWGLIIDARDPKALEQARSELAKRTNVIAIPGSVTDESHRKALAESAGKLGGLDLLVNNASFLGPSPQPSLQDYPLEVLEQVYRTNVIAPLALIQALSSRPPTGCLHHQRDQRCGSRSVWRLGRIRVEQGRAGTSLPYSGGGESVAARVLGGPRRYAHADAAGSLSR